MKKEEIGKKQEIEERRNRKEEIGKKKEERTLLFL